MADQKYFPPPAPLLALTFNANEVSSVRRIVTREVSQIGLHGEQLTDFVLAVNEIVTNAVAHDTDHGQLHLWDHGGSVECKVTDPRPAVGTTGDPFLASNRGLRMARLLVDIFDVLSSPTGTVVRVIATLPRARLTPANV